MFGVTEKLRNIYGYKPNEPIYDVEFEVVEENAKYPDEVKQEYWCLLEDGEHCLIQPNVICFTIQFPYPIFDHQGESRGEDLPPFGTVERLKVKSYNKRN